MAAPAFSMQSLLAKCWPRCSICAPVRQLHAVYGLGLRLVLPPFIAAFWAKSDMGTYGSNYSGTQLSAQLKLCECYHLSGAAALPVEPLQPQGLQ